MKELSIEEKAKAYDEALEKSKEFYILCKKCGAKDTVDFLEDSFPELRESEDEKIRKKLKHYLEVRRCQTQSDEEYINCNNFLAWLEKQGVQKPIDKIQLGKKYKCIASPRYSTFRRGNIYKPVDNFLCNLMNLCYECFEPIEDSEQKPTDEDMKEALRTEYEKGRADAFAQMQKEWSEEDESIALGIEQIVNCASLLNIAPDKLNKVRDWLKCIKDRVYPKHEWKQENTDDLTDFENAMMHIGKSFFGKNAGLDPNDTNVIKEQANTLLGLVPSKEWSEEDECTLNGILDDYKSMCKTYRNWLESLKNRIQPQQKQEWSEEDEVKINRIVACLENLNVADNDILLKDVDWLKSLRPQNWTKEDKERYISCLQRLGTGNPEQPETINSKWFKEHVYPQPTWKPSDEQMEALFVLLPTVSYGKNPAFSLYNDLKKLKGE